MNALRGLLDLIAWLASEFQLTEVVACWDDDWRPQWRVDLIRTYKTHRVAVVQPAVADHPIEAVPSLLNADFAALRAPSWISTGRC